MRGGYVEKWETAYTDKFPENFKDIISNASTQCRGCITPAYLINKEDLKKYLKEDVSPIFNSFRTALNIPYNGKNSFDQSIDEICEKVDAIVAKTIYCSSKLE